MKVEHVRLSPREKAFLEAGRAFGAAAALESAAEELVSIRARYELEIRAANGDEGVAQMKPWLDAFEGVAAAFRERAAAMKAESARQLHSAARTAKRSPSPVRATVRRLARAALRRLAD